MGVRICSGGLQSGKGMGIAVVFSDKEGLSFTFL